MSEESKVQEDSKDQKEIISPVKEDKNSIIKRSHVDDPDFIYADFFFGFMKLGMHRKISVAMSKLRQGETITIKAFDTFASRAILMA